MRFYISRNIIVHKSAYIFLNYFNSAGYQKLKLSRKKVTLVLLVAAF